MKKLNRYLRAACAAALSAAMMTTSASANPFAALFSWLPSFNETYDACGNAWNPPEADCPHH